MVSDSVHNFHLFFSFVGQGRRRLKKDVVPSLFPFHRQPSLCAQQRVERGHKRKQEELEKFEMEAPSQFTVPEPALDLYLGSEETVEKENHEEIV